jgi:hypothetical protein
MNFKHFWKNFLLASEPFFFFKFIYGYNSFFFPFPALGLSANVSSVVQKSKPLVNGNDTQAPKLRIGGPVLG